MPRSVTLSIHLGDADVRAIATDGAGWGAATSARIETLAPQPGWAEQRPDEWWDALVDAIRALARDLQPGEVSEIRLSSSLQASVFLDGEHEVIRPAILESDTRAADEAAGEIERALGRSSDGPLAAHLLWMRRYQAIAFKRVRTALSPKGYVRFRLTGALACDAADAGATGLFDADASRWSEEACDALEISMDILPPVLIAGGGLPLIERAAADLALPAGTPVTG